MNESSKNCLLWRFTAGCVLLIVFHGAGCNRQETESNATSAIDMSKEAATAPKRRDKAKPKLHYSTSPSAKSPDSTTISFIPTIQLVPFASVQIELQLTDGQKKTLTEIDQKRHIVHETWSEAGGNISREQNTDRLMAARRRLSEEVLEVLNKDQRDRLSRIAVQVNGAISLLDPFMAIRLQITDEQLAKFREIVNAKNEEIRKVTRAGSRGPSVKDLVAKCEEIRAKADKAVLALLTDQQKHEFESVREPMRVSSLSNASMVTKLNISETQQVQLTAIQRTLHQNQRNLIKNRRDRNRPDNDLRAKLQQLSIAADKEMLAILNIQQRQLLDSLPRNPRRPSVLTDPQLDTKLRFTDEQKAKLATIRETDMRDLQILSREVRKREAASKERAIKRKELRAEAEEEMLAVLTVDQFLAFASLKNDSPRISYRDLQASNDPSK